MPTPAGLWSSCQEMSNTLGTNHNVTWGNASPEDQQWWMANNCATVPTGAALAAKDAVSVGSVNFGIMLTLLGMLGFRQKFNGRQRGALIP